MIKTNKFFMADAIRLRDRGLSVSAISKKLGVNEWACQRALRFLSIPHIPLVGKRNPMYGRRGEKSPILGAKNCMYGQTHTPEAKQKIIESNWLGDKAKPEAGRARCEKRYPVKQCELCGNTRTGNKNLHRHHRDKNPLNNEPENIQILCQHCHSVLHGQLKREAHNANS